MSVMSEEKVEHELDEDVGVMLAEAVGTVGPLIDGHPHFRERLAKATQEDPDLVANCRAEAGEDEVDRTHRHANEDNVDEQAPTPAAETATANNRGGAGNN